VEKASPTRTLSPRSRLEAICQQQPSHGARRHTPAELQQLTGDPRVPPARILAGEPQHQLSHLRIDRRTARLPSRLRPLASNQLAVPTQKCLSVASRPAPVAAAPVARGRAQRGKRDQPVAARGDPFAVRARRADDATRATRCLWRTRCADHRQATAARPRRQDRRRKEASTNAPTGDRQRHRDQEPRFWNPSGACRSSNQRRHRRAGRSPSRTGSRGEARRRTSPNLNRTNRPALRRERFSAGPSERASWICATPYA
jgi:hypothetical protein